MGRLLLAALFLFGAARAGAEPSSLPARPLDDRALIAALRAGGLVLYIRHTSTDFSKDDAGMKSFEDCANQRSLSEQGRAEARGIGVALRKLRIPVGKVLASPFCRTVETAMLVFGRAEKSHAVRGGPVKSEDPERYAGLKALMTSPPARGKNAAISSHGNPFYAVFGPPYLEEGEIAVIRPGRGGGLQVIARIKERDWERLVQQ